MPKQVGKCREREKTKIIGPFRSYTTRNRKFQKIAKKFKNLKNTIMASFQAKISVKGCEREKIKIIITFRSNPTRNRKFQKNSKKIQKIKKYRYVFFSSQNRFDKEEKVRK